MLTRHGAGYLAKDPQARTSAKNTQYATGSLVCSTRDGDLLVNLTVFDAGLVDTLMGLRKGDTVSVLGQATIGVWETDNGDGKPSVSITVSRMMTTVAKMAAPKPRRSKPEAAPVADVDDFDDWRV